MTTTLSETRQLEQREARVRRRLAEDSYGYYRLRKSRKPDEPGYRILDLQHNIFLGGPDNYMDLEEVEAFAGLKKPAST